MEAGPQAVNRTAPIPAPVRALVHPPETNVQSQLTPPSAGVDEPPGTPSAPLQTADSLTDYSHDVLNPLRPLEHDFPLPQATLDAREDSRNREHPLHDTNKPILFRHSGWAHDRRRVYDALLRTGQPCARIHDFTACGKYAYVFQSVEDPEVYTLGGSTCHDRFCLPCGRERSRVIAGNVKLRVQRKPARFLTLTLKSDTESLAYLLAKLSRDFAALRRTKLWRKRVTGGVAFLEVKWKANTDRWHVHLHALLQGRYVPQRELSKLWLKVTGTSEIIDIRIVEDEAHCTHYICKYASKPLDRTVVVVPLRLDEAILALKGKRLCMTFGTWRGYKLTEPPESGTWVQLGTLDEIIGRAETGDVIAGDALDALRIEYALSTRAPPGSTVPTVSSLTLDQRDLDYGPGHTQLPDAYGT